LPAAPSPGDSTDTAQRSRDIEALTRELAAIAESLDLLRRIVIIGGVIIIVLMIIGVVEELHISSQVSNLQGRI
jgi:hypothetical protein